MKPAISIVIPALNEEGEVGELLTLLKAHGGDQVAEVIVVDGGSKDQTREEALDAGAVVLSPDLPEGACRAHQMNAGATLCSGDLLWFVHADTRPPVTFCNDLTRAWQEQRDFGSYAFQFASDRWILRVTSWFTRFRSLMVRGGDQTLFVRREVWQEVGAFDPDFVVMEEYEWMLRAEKRGYRFHRLTGTIAVSARKHRNRNYFKVQYANWKAFRMFRKGAPPDEIRQFYAQGLERARRRKSG